MATMMMMSMLGSRAAVLLNRSAIAMTQVAAPIHRRHLSSLTTEASGIQRVCVVGAGTLGAQVAVQTALRGFEVSVLDVSQESLDRCQEAHRAIAKQYVTRDASPASQARGWRGLSSPSVPAAKVAADALDRLSYTTSFEEALRACDLVSENVPEVPDIKASTYASLHEHAPKGTIFTTNSSTLLPSQFAKDTGRPHHFCALHFANGIWDANIGEVMPHSGTSEETVRTVLRFAKEIGMVPFHVRKEQNGYLINTLLVPWLNASLTLAQRGVSVPADVDRAWLISTGGCNAPPGSVLGPVRIFRFSEHHLSLDPDTHTHTTLLLSPLSQVPNHGHHRPNDCGPRHGLLGRPARRRADDRKRQVREGQVP